MSQLLEEVRQSRTGGLVPMTADKYLRSFVFAPEFIGFAGHFPADPIVPAVVQLMVGQVLVEDVKNSALRLQAVRNAKFTKKLLPEMEIEAELTVKQHDSGERFFIRLTAADEPAAKFELIFEPGNAPAERGGE